MRLFFVDFRTSLDNGRREKSKGSEAIHFTLVFWNEWHYSASRKATKSYFIIVLNLIRRIIFIIYYIYFVFDSNTIWLKVHSKNQI
nr:MAG TPA: hypothetical protein [Caudoviricetes sp.]